MRQHGLPGRAVIRQMYPHGLGQLEPPGMTSHKMMRVVAATAPHGASGWRNWPPERDKSLLHEGKCWVERQMEARSFEGKILFWRLEVGKKQISHNHYLKKYPPRPIPPKRPTIKQQKKPLLPHGPTQFPPAQLMAVSSFHLLIPKTFESSLILFLQILYLSTCQSVGSILKADPTTSDISRLLCWAQTPQLLPGLCDYCVGWGWGVEGVEEVSPYYSLNFYLCLFSVSFQ